jgi:hypothetical protein
MLQIALGSFVAPRRSPPVLIKQMVKKYSAHEKRNTDSFFSKKIFLAEEKI